MRIAYLLTTADARAGTEKTFADQARAMVARGHEVEVLSVYRLGRRGFDYGDGVEVEYLTELPEPAGAPSLVIPQEWDNQFCASADAALIRRLAAGGHDILVTSTPALTLHALLSSPDGVRIVQEEHRPSMARGITGVPLLRHGTRVDAQVVLTERNAEWLKAQWGSNAPRIEVIPNALPATGRPRSGGGQNVVMSAGRFVRSKGFGDLIRAFSRVSGEFPEWRLRIFGDGPLRPDLLRLARDLGVAGVVELMGPTEEIEIEWSRATIGALASTYEGLPLVLLEARGAGLPVVAYDCETGPREIIEDGKDGLLVPPRSVEGLADALRTLMGDEARRREMSERAPESLRRFAPERVADQWETLFEELVQDPGPVRRRQEPSDQERGDAGAGAPETTGRASSEPAGDEEPGAGDRAITVTDAQAHLYRAREATRAALEELFAGCSVTSRPLRSGRGDSWAVRMTEREQMLQHLVDHDADLEELEVRLYSGTSRLDDDGRSWRRDRDAVAWEDVTRVFLIRHYNVENTGIHVGYAAGISVEFWDQDERRTGLFRARQTNDEVEVLTPEQFDRPLFTAWSPMRGRPLWTTVEFPIDVVYTWVDGSDSEWRRRREAVRSGDGAEAPSDLSHGEIRYLDRGELKYSLRALSTHLPWVRRIHLVTDAQRPSWLVEDEQLRVVDHRQLFPDTSVLPVFNSHAIETVLHRIPDLAEHFLYLNDDGFFLREQRPEQYFTPSGQARFFPSPTKINELGALAEPHEQAAMNNRDLIEERFGRTITQGMLHSPHPHLRTVLGALEERYSDEFARTRAARFRSGTDISLVSSLAQHTGNMEGSYVHSGLRVAFVPLGADDSASRLAKARTARLDYLTLGEAGGDDDPEYTLEMMTNFLENRFPIPSPWERHVETQGAAPDVVDPETGEDSVPCRGAYDD